MTTSSLAELAKLGGRVIQIHFAVSSIPGKGHVHDLAYVVGRLPDGSTVEVLPSVSKLIPTYRLKNHLIGWATREHVSAKDLNLLTETLWTYS